MQKNSLNMIIVVSAIIIGMLGAIFFFPLKLNSGKTCFFHRICTSKNKVDVCTHRQHFEDNAHEMLYHYLRPYALIWWLSLAIVALGGYQLRKWKATK